MASIAEFAIPAEEFALRATLERLPAIEIEIDRVVAHDATHVLPFVWVSGDGSEDVPAILDDDPSVDDWEVLAEYENEQFYRMAWADEAQIIAHMVVEHDATVQRAIARNGEWHLRVLFPERSSVSAAHDYAQHHEFALDLKRLYDVDTIRRVRYNLTSEQHEALVEGLQRGYYDIPRDAQLEDLADTLDISHQALSERFRRATKRLIENALLVDEDDDGQR